MIEIRRAQLGDIPTIKKLSLEVAELAIPANRDVPNAQVREVAQAALQGLDRLLFKRREVAMLVACDPDAGGRVVGFIFLEFNHIEETTGEAQSFINNLCVEDEYLGKYIGHKLVWEAAKLSYERGFRYMTSRITASNERALLSAIKLGFEIERYQLTLACGPEGRARMPGRPMAERSHEISRLLRTRNRRKKKTGELS